MPGFGVGFKEYLSQYPGVDMEFERLYAFLRNFMLTEHNEDGTHRVAPIALAISEEIGFPVGSIIMWTLATPPTNWLLCNGAAISRVGYQTLFQTIGTTYGVGDGSTTFNLPDLRQRFPLGLAAAGTGSVLAGTGGNIDHVHTGPSHALS